MGGERQGMEKFGDGLDLEIDGFDAFFDDAGDEAWAERDEDDVTGFEVEWRGISQNRAANAENFCGDHLEKHISII